MEYLDTEVVMRKDLMYTKIRDMFTNGVSDILLCVRGIFVAAELKAEDGAPSFKQERFIEDVEKAGGIGGVCYCVNDIAKLIGKARERAVKL